MLLRDRAFLAFLAASLLMQVSHGPFYTYFSLYLQQHGFTRTAIGLLWALGVIAEIGVFAVSWRLLRGFSLRHLMLASMLLAVLRWIITGFGVDSVLLLAIAQCLHAATYGCLHAASVELIRRHFGAVHQGQGQAMYNAVSYGLGGSLGALLSGYLWEYDARLGFMLAAGVAALSGLIIWSMVRGPLVEECAPEAAGIERYDIAP
jgi:PPP family 3-phenylpropionic acid transporter